MKRIGAGEAHARTNFGGGTKVGIVDTGIDYDHPDLAANFLSDWDFVNNDTDPDPHPAPA